MHEIRVYYYDYDRSVHADEVGYHVEVHCDLVHDSILVAILKEPADALRFANWKGTEMGLTVDLGWKLKEALGIVKKEIKKGKKRKEKKK